MEELIITWGGWICTVISTIIAVIQLFQKEKLKKQIIKIQSNSNNETYSATNKSVAAKIMNGDINIH